MSENEKTESEGDSSGDALLDALDVVVPESYRPEDPQPVVGPEEPTVLDAPPKEKEYFRCSKGHITEGLWTWIARESEDNPVIVADSGPICRVCWAIWCGSRFRTRPYQKRAS